MLAAAQALEGGGVDRFTHGTTVATNALLERKGARTAFVATRRLRAPPPPPAPVARTCTGRARHPEPLVPLDRCFQVQEHMAPDGVVERLDLGRCRRSTPTRWPLPALLVPPPSTTRRRGGCAAGLPGAFVVASHEVAPSSVSTSRRRWRLWTRTSARGLALPRRLVFRAAAVGLPEPLVIRSSGGVASLEEASAPGGGRAQRSRRRGVGAAAVARAAGFEDALALDMGGTSTDVSLVQGGRGRSDRRTSGRRACPSAAVAGRAYRRRRRRLARLAGRRRRASRRAAERGRHLEARVLRARRQRTHRHRREPRPRPPAGPARRRRSTRPRRGRGGARRPRRRRRGTRRRRGARACAAGHVRGAGHDPRKLALVAFGGAGRCMPARSRKSLPIGTVLCARTRRASSPRSGLVVGDRRRDRVRSYVRPLGEVAICRATAKATCAMPNSPSS